MKELKQKLITQFHSCYPDSERSFEFQKHVMHKDEGACHLKVTVSNFENTKFYHMELPINTSEKNYVKAAQRFIKTIINF